MISQRTQDIFIGHLQIALSRQEYIRCQQDNLTENNCKSALGKTYKRSLIKMYPSDASKTSFKDIFLTNFF